MMNTLPKSLTIAFLAISVFISGLTVDFAGAQNTAVSTVASRRSADQVLSRYLKFGRLTSEDGLSNVQITGIAQDNLGFIWFGTAGGLNRYDGSSIKMHRHDPDDSYRLSHNIIRAMIADQSGDLWFGTWGSGCRKYPGHRGRPV